MEYRCRLGTATGEILEEVHVSDSEAHLRHELEQKGFCVLGMRPAGALGRVSLPGRVRRKIRIRIQIDGDGLDMAAIGSQFHTALVAIGDQSTAVGSRHRAEQH